MYTVEFEFTPLKEARNAAMDVRLPMQDAEVYDLLVTSLENYLESVSPDMVRGRARIECYADAQVCKQSLQVWVWPSPLPVMEE